MRIFANGGLRTCAHTHEGAARYARTILNRSSDDPNLRKFVHRELQYEKVITVNYGNLNGMFFRQF